MASAVPHLLDITDEEKRNTPEPLGDDELKALVEAEIREAIAYADSELKGDRTKAAEYYRGEMSDLPFRKGTSEVVDHTVQDVIGWELPGLMRVFFSADQMVIYEPVGPEDEAAAEQATDYVNQVVLRESEAYRVFWDAFHNALLHGNGVVKHYWDHTLRYTVHTMCVSEDQMAQILASDPTLEVLAHSQREPVLVDTPDGPVPYVYHDLKVKRGHKRGLTIKAVPPEHFLINKEATSIEEARFVGERLLLTRSELLQMGFDPEVVNDLPSGRSINYDEMTIARSGHSGVTGAAGIDHALDEIEVIECYPLADLDGDGIAERLKVVMAGNEILDAQAWDDDEIVYSDLVPERIPHQWKGRSIFDDTQDIQRIKTALLRGQLNNLYMVNEPVQVVDERQVINPDAVLDREIGAVIRVNGNPAAAIMNLEVPFTAAQSFPMLEYMDGIVEKRTGVSRSSMGLDPETLQNQSATAATIQQAAAYSKQDLIARNFAEGGMKRIFRMVLRLVVKHQDQPRVARLRNNWIEVDPRGWNADMDATVNIGLGSGSRDRDVGFLGLVLQQQKEVLAMVGGAATTYGRKIAKAVNTTQAKLVEATGLKSPDTYFPEITDEELEEIAQASGQDPDAGKEEAKTAAATQLEQFKAQVAAQLEQQRNDHRMALEEMQARADIAVRDREVQVNAQMEERKFEFQRELKLLDYDFQRQLKLLDHQLKRELGLANAAVKASTSSVEVGGEPG